MLGLRGILHLPEFGNSIPLKSGDGIRILANEQLHKFEMDADDRTSQIVLAIRIDEPNLSKTVEHENFD